MIALPHRSNIPPTPFPYTPRCRRRLRHPDLRSHPRRKRHASAVHQRERRRGPPAGRRAAGQGGRLKTTMGVRLLLRAPILPAACAGLLALALTAAPAHADGAVDRFVGSFVGSGTATVDDEQGGAASAETRDLDVTIRPSEEGGFTNAWITGVREIGRAACRDGGGEYGKLRVDARAYKKKTYT